MFTQHEVQARTLRYKIHKNKSTIQYFLHTVLLQTIVILLLAGAHTQHISSFSVTRRTIRVLHVPQLYNQQQLLVPSLTTTTTLYNSAVNNSNNLPASSDSTEVTATEVTATISNRMKCINGLQDIVNDYDIYFIDMWGVLHDGKQPYDNVLHTFQQFQRCTINNNNKKYFILLSNSSKRYNNSLSNLQQLGFNVDLFHSIITSGEVTYQLLLDSSSSTHVTKDDTKQQLWGPLQTIVSSNQPRTIYIFGSGDDDVSYCTSCGWIPVSNINDASLLLARGPFTIPINDDSKGNTETSIDTTSSTYNVIDRRQNETLYLETMEHVLQIAATKAIPMIVSNPDKVRPDSDRSPMPGQIGDLYESILNKVHSSRHPDPLLYVKRIGKPFTDVYDLAIERILSDTSDGSTDTTIDKRRVCMIGDALETDVVGGTKFGIDTIWVLKNGVHSIDLEQYTNRQQEQSDNSNNNNNMILFERAANHVLHQFNENNIGTYAEGITLSPTIAIPYFQW